MMEPAAGAPAPCLVARPTPPGSPRRGRDTDGASIIRGDVVAGRCAAVPGAPYWRGGACSCIPVTRQIGRGCDFPLTVTGALASAIA